MAIIDVHAHFGEWPFPARALDAPGMLALMDRHGIARAIFSSVLAIVYDMEEGNRRLAETLKASERLFGYVVLNPNFPERSRREMDRYFDHPAFVGAKLHASYSRSPIGSERTQRLIAEVAARGKPLLLHTWGAADIAAVAATTAAEGPPVIMGHAGADAWREGIRAAAENPRLYLDFCSSYAERDKIAQALAGAGAEKIVFGSDMDLIAPSFTLAMFEDTPMSDSQRDAICAANARRIFGWRSDSPGN